MPSSTFRKNAQKLASRLRSCHNGVTPWFTAQRSEPLPEGSIKTLGKGGFFYSPTIKGITQSRQARGGSNRPAGRGHFPPGGWVRSRPALTATAALYVLQRCLRRDEYAADVDG